MKRYTAAWWVKGMADTFTAAGLPLAAILAEAGIEEALLDDPDARFPTESISQL